MLLAETWASENTCPAGAKVCDLRLQSKLVDSGSQNLKKLINQISSEVLSELQILGRKETC